MLPAIVNANLARGAFLLAKKKAIVKRLDSIQNLGAMSVLCSDKVSGYTILRAVMLELLDGKEKKLTPCASRLAPSLMMRSPSVAT
jgi:hypothetical protein